MRISKEELVNKIEVAREKLNTCIDKRDDYKKIYETSIELDELIELYIVSGF